MESWEILSDKHTQRRLAGDYFDFIVWFDERDEIFGFHLRYDKWRHERALTWFNNAGCMHHRVDDGEHTIDIIRKATPILVSDGSLDHREIAELFRGKWASGRTTNQAYCQSAITGWMAMNLRRGKISEDSERNRLELNCTICQQRPLFHSKKSPH